MKFAHWIFLLNVFLQREGVAHEPVQEKNDHLTCFKIKSDSNTDISKPSYKDFTVKMDANMVQREMWSVDKCKVKKARRFCVPSTKTVIPEGAGSDLVLPDPTVGGLVDGYDPNRCIQNDLLCYKVKCLKRQRRRQEVRDQFNKKKKRTLAFSKTKSYEICTPTWKVDSNGDIILNAPCPFCCGETDECNTEGGKCVKDCEESKTMTCTKDCKQDEGCECAIPKCEQPQECADKRGTCVKNCTETADAYCENSCEPFNISSDKCMCKITKTVLECKQNNTCTEAMGECVPKADCIAIANEISCRDLCDKEKCICQIKNISTPCVENVCCTRNGGKCKMDCKDSDTVICEDWCDPTIDSQDKCMCEVQKTCVDSESCTAAEGACVPSDDCTWSDTVRCENLCQTRNFPGVPETCVCKVDAMTPCARKPKCQDEGGKCKKLCKETEDLYCKDICGSTGDEIFPCMCELNKRKPCDPDGSEECTARNGACVPSEDCTPSRTVLCENLCQTPNFPNATETCVCKIDATTPCAPKPKCHAVGGKCKKKCEETEDLYCEDWCDPTIDSKDKCMCELNKRRIPCDPDGSEECTARNGACVPSEDCTPSLGVECKNLCQTPNFLNAPETCMCKIDYIVINPDNPN